jgi:energy-coupling factor transporter ATP-binding protein EcfA2
MWKASIQALTARGPRCRTRPVRRECWGTTAPASQRWPSTSTPFFSPRGGTYSAWTAWIPNEAQNLWKVRQEAGMVFQNPDNQIIGQVVEEDVGFGPGEPGYSLPKEIWERVEGEPEDRRHGRVCREKIAQPPLRRTETAGLHSRCASPCIPSALSWTSRPPCWIPRRTPRSHPGGARPESRWKSITIILITHYMEEAVYAQTGVFVMDEGKAGDCREPRGRSFPGLRKCRLCISMYRR